MRDVDAAWAAGFLEADGSFTIARRRGAAQTARGQGARAVISATQIDRRPLDRLCEMFGGAVYQPRSRTARGLFQWQVTKTSDVAVCLDAIQPHLVSKFEHAALLYAFCVGPGRPQGRTPLAPETIAARDRYADRLSALNRGGLAASISAQA